MKKYLLHVLIISFVFIAIPITSATGGSITLRSYNKSLSASQVQSLPNVVITASNNYDTFEGYSTINHDYDLKTMTYRQVYVEVVVDNATGLMWMREGSDNYLKWDEAQKWVTRLNQLGYAGYQDWRLPTLEEAASLLESSRKRRGCLAAGIKQEEWEDWEDLYIDMVFSKKQKAIWTGDRKDDSGATWYVSFYDGHVHWYDIFFISYRCVRPVRSVK